MEKFPPPPSPPLSLLTGTAAYGGKHEKVSFPLPSPPTCIQEFEFWGSWQRGTHVQTLFALSLFSRYVLVVQPDVRQSQVEATALEETLLFLRFPKSRVRRRHTSATIPRTVSNRSFHVETSFEMWLDSSLSVKMQFLSGISREFYNWYLSYIVCWDRSEVKVGECKNKFYFYICIQIKVHGNLLVTFIAFSSPWWLTYLLLFLHPSIYLFIFSCSSVHFCLFFLFACFFFCWDPWNIGINEERKEKK